MHSVPLSVCRKHTGARISTRVSLTGFLVINSFCSSHSSTENTAMITGLGKVQNNHNSLFVHFKVLKRILPFYTLKLVSM